MANPAARAVSADFARSGGTSASGPVDGAPLSDQIRANDNLIKDVELHQLSRDGEAHQPPIGRATSARNG